MLCAFNHCHVPCRECPHYDPAQPPLAYPTKSRFVELLARVIVYRSQPATTLIGESHEPRSI